MQKIIKTCGTILFLSFACVPVFLVLVPDTSVNLANEINFLVIEMLILVCEYVYI